MPSIAAVRCQTAGMAASSTPALPSSPLHERLGITIESMSADEVLASMPVEGNTQPFGRLHGGASAALAEGAASVAANLHAMGTDQVAVGVDLSITHHRGVATGRVHARASCLSRGGRVASYEIHLTDDEGRRVATARLTCLLTSGS